MVAQYGELTARGRSGRGYLHMFYLDDADASLANMDGGAGASATSPEKWTVPEAMTITDICIAAATGQTKTTLLVSGARTGHMLLNALHLASVVSRPTIGLTIPAGAELSLEQNA